ncbi:MAG: hypothetical protein AAGA75_23620 [Cyanobacteria bacterium P01_E01_bin.6]
MSLGGSTFSASGGNQPPAPEVQQPAYHLEDTQIETELILNAEGIDDDRPFELEIPTATSIAQLQDMGERWGIVQKGRSFGISYETDLRDEFLDTSYAPLKCIDFIEQNFQDGLWHKWRYLSDGDTFSLSERQAVTAADGIYYGEVTRTVDGGGTPSSVENDPLAGESDNPSYISTVTYTPPTIESTTASAGIVSSESSTETDISGTTLFTFTQYVGALELFSFELEAAIAPKVNATAAIETPGFELEAIANISVGSTAALEAPEFELEASIEPSLVTSAAMESPTFELDASVDLSLVTSAAFESPSFEFDAVIDTPFTAIAALESPAFELDASITIGTEVTAAMDAPDIELTASINLSALPPLPTVSGLEFHFYDLANTTTLQGDGDVETAEDQSTNNNDLDNSSSAGLGDLITGPNSTTALKNSNGGLLLSTTVGSSNSWSFFVVCKLDGAVMLLAANNFVSWFSVTSTEMEYRANGTGDRVTANHGVTTTNWHLYEFHVDAGSVSLVVDGTEVGTGTTTASPSFRRWNGTGAGLANANTEWTEKVLYSAVLSSTDKATLRSRMAADYGITIS